MINFLNQILKSKYFPLVFQLINVIVFSYVPASLFFGPSDTGSNFGSTITWILWWPLIPITFLLLGRVWCAMCPFATIGDWIQAHFSLKKPVPKFLKRYGLWIINISFILITWYDLTYGLVSSTRASAYFLLFVVFAAALTSVFFARRTWCRYLCFLGGIFGNYSQTSFIELRTDPDKCKTCRTLDCYNGNEKAPGCILYEVPRVMDSNRTCNLCGDCLKSCNNDSPALKFRGIPGSELWTKKHPRFDESFLASTLIGIILISGFGMLEAWKPFFHWFQSYAGIANEQLAISVLFIIMLAIPVMLLMLVSFISSLFSKESTVVNFTRYAYALIPLNLAGHFAHNLFHFLGEGKSIGTVTASLFSGGKVIPQESGERGTMSSASLLDVQTTQFLQYILVFIGIAASLYIAFRIFKREEKGNLLTLVPHIALILIFGAQTFLLFAMPMDMRH